MSHTYHYWKTTEEKFLRDNYSTKTAQWIADTLDLTLSAVTNYVRILGLRKR